MGMQMTQYMFAKFSSGQAAELPSIFQELGKIMKAIHLTYRINDRSMQHGDCQPSNVFYDEASGVFTLIDVADFGFGPYLAQGGGDDVQQFIDGLHTLTPWYGKKLIEDCALFFRMGYCITRDLKHKLKHKEDAESYRHSRIMLVSRTIQPFMRELMELLAPRLRPGSGIKVAYIPDAMIGGGLSMQEAYARIAPEFQSVHVREMCCVELRGCSIDKLAKQLDGVDCIYCLGGNTFYLRYQMIQSGFDKLIPRLVHDEGIVYIGMSAGAICAGGTIKTAFWKGWDKPGFGEAHDLSDIGYDGLDLLPGGKSVFPHYALQFQQLVSEKRTTLDHELVILDEQICYILHGGEERYIPHRVIVN
jgi:peptidase E